MTYVYIKPIQSSSRYVNVMSILYFNSLYDKMNNYQSRMSKYSIICQIHQVVIIHIMIPIGFISLIIFIIKLLILVVI